jgi:ethanolamine permease
VTQPETASVTASEDAQNPKLERTLGPWMLWGLGVGYVIGGEYFGWNLGLLAGGSLGMMAAFLIVTLLYVCFVFCYAEMACAVPKAGGVFDYAQWGINQFWAYVAGISQVLEFLFAPPALAMAVGAYIAPIVQPVLGLGPKPLAILALGLVTIINVRGVKQAAAFELSIAIVSSIGLILFAWLVAPSFQMQEYLRDPLPNGFLGIFQALPFAIWMYLGIEGLANVAEESRNPSKDIPRGFGGSLVTLMILAAVIMVLSVGVKGWHSVVYNQSDLSTISGQTYVAKGAVASDSPLTLALDAVGALNSPAGRLFQAMGLFGLVSSLNGLSLASGRALLEMGRAKYLPSFLGTVHPRFHTPAKALIFNFVVGTVALLVLDTAKLITWSALGAVLLYIFSIPALVGLRKKHPNLVRPFITPFYPWMPAISFILSIFCFLAMLIGNLDQPGAFAPLTEYGSVVIEFGLFWVLAMIYYFAVVKPGKRIATTHDSN